jgi:hypothetical protein
MHASMAAKATYALMAAGFTTTLAAASAQAATLAGLQDGKTIVWIDTAKKKVTGWVKLAGGASLIGFDVRPADGKLYGVTPDGAIVVVDAKTGKWEKKSQLSETLPKGATFSVDFNPVADRLRILSSAGLSLRVNVEDGKTIVDGQLKYADADANKGKQPKVIAGAYSNSFAGTKETALYDIDIANWTYVRQAPPNDGILNTLGQVTLETNGTVAFDVWSDGKGGNTGWLLTGGMLHMLDIANGATKPVGKITGLNGRITDIAVLPTGAPST